MPINYLFINYLLFNWLFVDCSLFNIYLIFIYSFIHIYSFICCFHKIKIGVIIIEWVVKIGGSLFPRKALELINALKNVNCLIILGGGEFANLIRIYDESIGFSNNITHETAIDSMDIIAKLINDKFTFTNLVYSIKDAENSLNNGFIPILACSEILKDASIDSELPHSWNITSDSISAYIANLLKAKLLIATNVDGIYTQKPTNVGAKFVHEIDAKKLLTFDETSVDLMLAEYLLKFGTNCFVVNGNFPQRVLSLIESNKDSKIIDNDYNNNYNFKYTIIRGE